jgi:phosphoribosylformylglycinamidine cyclo-ligase
MVKAAQLTPDEAYKTFNMGVGMSVICAPEDVVAVRDALTVEGFETFEMGKVVAGTGKVVYE